MCILYCPALEKTQRPSQMRSPRLGISFFRKKMGRALFGLTIFSFLLVGCTDRAQLEAIKSENEQLKMQKDSLLGSLDSMKKTNDSLTAVISKPKPKTSPAGTGETDGGGSTGGGYYSEDVALRFVEDYYDYYRGDYSYRNPRIRRISGNTFNVAVEECLGKFCTTDWEWQSVVWRLEIKSKSKYIMRMLY
jgi:hypothetical protein